MTPQLYAHPFSSYSQKAVMAFYEKDEPFDFQMLAPDNPPALAEWSRLWPLARFPVLKAGDRVVCEATAIIEWLEIHATGGTRLIPEDPEAALDVRMRDRIFDNYVMTPMQRIVAERMRPDDAKDPRGLAEARDVLDRAYDWLDGDLAGRQWAAGGAFGMADCAAAPALFYANWVRPFEGRPNLAAYYARLYDRPSFRRAVDEARPYRTLFPGGAPTDRG